MAYWHGGGKKCRARFICLGNGTAKKKKEQLLHNQEVTAKGVEGEGGGIWVLAEKRLNGEQKEKKEKYHVVFPRKNTATVKLGEPCAKMTPRPVKAAATKKLKTTP